MFDAVMFGAFSKMNLLMEISCGNKLSIFLSDSVFVIVKITQYRMGVEEWYLLLIAKLLLDVLLFHGQFTRPVCSSLQ